MAFNRDTDVGGGWLRNLPSGGKMLSMRIDFEKAIQLGAEGLIALKNNFKDDDRKPDYRIYASLPRDAAPSTPTGRAGPKSAPAPVELDDEIPFAITPNDVLEHRLEVQHGGRIPLV